MGSRGRTSVAELETPSVTDSIEKVPRPDAPYDLTDEEAEEWRAIIDRVPADWFPRETWAMLAQYCRHVISARHISRMIQEFLKRNKARKSKTLVRDYNRLLAMQMREGNAIMMLATKMRISQQSSYDKSRKKKASITPWQG